MSEAAAAGLAGPQGGATQNQPPQWDPNLSGHPGGADSPWGAPGPQGIGYPGQYGQAPGTGTGDVGMGAPGQDQWPVPNQSMQPNQPGQPGPGVGQSPWTGQPAAYQPNELSQGQWGAPGPGQQASYPGGAGQDSHPAPGMDVGQYGNAAPEQNSPAAEQYAPAPGQYGTAPGQYGTAPGQPPATQYGAPGQPGQPWGGSQFNGPAPSLDDVPYRKAKKSPGSGWRKAVHHMSGGSINPGMSAEERRLQELVARIRQPVRGDYRIAVLSLKGGVGKTTTTMGLGSIFSSIRGDRVIAVDANPDFGTLSQRVPLQTRSTVRDLLLDEHIQRYSDVRRHTSQGSSRLEVLASERDPAASEAFSEEEYRAVARILQRFYNIILTDCGTGLMHSAMAGVLDLAHSLVLISSSAIDGARSAAATLDWLSLHGHDHLVRNAVVVINLPRPGAPNVGINQLRDYFLSRCRAVHIIPYDPHLGEGAEIDLHRLSKPTKRAYVELAATVADDFSADHRRYRG
ncbi:MinD/ParA family ATP-binding protein [Nocardia yunnanensis]|nr:MinD/ParA family protein [Nocardia yunnanensis]